MKKLQRQKLQKTMDRKWSNLQKLGLPYGMAWIAKHDELMQWYEKELKKI